jgi:biopolymer transport protein ExbD
MKYVLSVCLVAGICSAVVMHLAARPSIAQVHAMQKGISVEMPTVSNAQTWLQADDIDAWVVTIDNTGQLYLGTNAMTLEELEQWMIRHPRRREQKLFIKADAQASYASVEKALDAASAADFAEPVLLVNRKDNFPAPGTVVPPQGLEVAIDGGTQDSQLVVKIGSQKGSATLTVNDEPVSWDSLQDRLREFVQDKNVKSIRVEANGRVPFAQIARVIDACVAINARAVLSASTL